MPDAPSDGLTWLVGIVAEPMKPLRARHRRHHAPQGQRGPRESAGRAEVADAAEATSDVPAIADAQAEPTFAARLRAARPDLLALLIITVFAIVLVGLHVNEYTEISPIDELPHIDTMLKWSRFEAVPTGDVLGEEAMREQACRGFDRDTFVPPCDSPELRPDFFQDYGVNTVGDKLPVYHLLTGLGARALTAVAGLESPVTAARLLGGLWLAAGLIMTWLLLGEFRVHRLARAALVGLLATTPVVLHTSAIVNPDVTLLVAGAGVLYAVLLWERGAVRSWVPAVVGAAALATEYTSIVCVGAAAAYLLLRARAARSRPVEGSRPRRLAVMGAGFAVGAVLIGAVLPIVHDALVGDRKPKPVVVSDEARAVTYVPPEITWESVDSDRYIDELGAVISPVHRPFIPEFLAGSVTNALIQFTDWLLIASMVAAVLWARPGGRIELLAVAVLVALLATGPLHTLMNARRDVFFATPPRFGLPVLPAMVAFVAIPMNGKRSVLIAVCAFSLFAVLYTLSRLV